jgi:hypothetical protein
MSKVEGKFIPLRNDFLLFIKRASLIKISKCCHLVDYNVYLNLPLQLFANFFIEMKSAGYGFLKANSAVISIVEHLEN